MARATSELETMDPRLLTELQKQDTVLAELPEDYEFPLFNGRQAVESQRKSAYKNTPRAAREIIDNAFEAGAKHVWVIFRRPSEAERAKHERRDAVSAIAFIDNGPGMRPNMARYALSWGGGTRFNDPTGIGRFGFGLPNSSINQTRRVEVYTRTNPDTGWVRAVLDISAEKMNLFGLVKVEPVEEGVDLPQWVADYIKRNKIDLPSGTIVVWERPDRLSARSASKLRENMLDDFGVVYRYLLDKFEIIVDGVSVEKVDPLFLTGNARYYQPEQEGGAWCRFDKPLTVKYYRDEETGAQHLELLNGTADIRAAQREPNVVVDTISVKVAGFPYGFAAKSVRVGYDEQGSEVRKTLSKDSPEFKRLQIRSSRRGFSFVRANREVDTLSNLPSLPSDKAMGLGEWPVLQSYALHWGVEVRFGPKLDEAFGIGNDKQTVGPIEDVWRVFHEAEVDRQIAQEESKQEEMRKKRKVEEAREQVTNTDMPNPATDAAAIADQAMTDGEPLPDEVVKAARERFDDTVSKKLAESGKPREEVQEEERQKAQEKKFAIRPFHSEGGVFYKPDFGNGLQRVALINTAHPFFQVFYTAVANMGDPRARQAVDVLLCALAKAELEADGMVKRIYQSHREDKWSPFLKLGLNLLDELQTSEVHEQQEEL